MKRKNSLLFLIILLLSQLNFAQDFKIENDRNKFSVYFQDVGNLIIVPISINGSVPLNFAIDTGSPYTIITNLNAIRHFQLKKGNSVTISGLGKDIMNLEAYLSKNNSIQIGKATSETTDIVLLFEEGFDLSSRFGIPIYGILGYDILKDFVVKVNYVQKKITFYNPEYFHSRTRLNKYTIIPLEIRGKKPYLKLDSQINNKNVELSLLIDTGSSEALWLFENPENQIVISGPFIEDYLGYGLNGEIHGKKTRIPQLNLGKYQLENLTTSFPDSISIANIARINRNGTVGSEVLRRFTTIYDYRNRNLYVKKNKYFKDEYHYNLAGLELYQPFPDLPYLEVAYIRKGSPAYKAGLKKGDAIRLVNEKKISVFRVNQFQEKFDAQETNVIYVEGKKRESITLPEIIELFKSQVGKKIHIVYTRGDSNLQVHTEFRLEKSI